MITIQVNPYIADRIITAQPSIVDRIINVAPDIGSVIYREHEAFPGPYVYTPGTQNTTWSNHVQNNHLTSVALTSGDKLRVYGRNSRGSSYYIYAPTLVIVEN